MAEESEKVKQMMDFLVHWNRSTQITALDYIPG
jgi:hypothetical protein